MGIASCLERRHYFYGYQGTSPTKRSCSAEEHTVTWCYRKIFQGHQAVSEHRSGSCAIDNKAIWSCKRRITEGLAENVSISILNHTIKVAWKNYGFRPETNTASNPSRVQYIFDPSPSHEDLPRPRNNTKYQTMQALAPLGLVTLVLKR